MTRNKKHIKGDQAELIAQEFFIKKGYYVFNNISQHGPVDMVVLDNQGYTLLIDVKAVSLRAKNGWKVNRVPTEEQEKLGVHIVYVNLDTREVLDEMPSKRKNKNNIVDIREWKKL
tara:strand:- start:273 stop:620 length:348 start_codon:yes stop_codon:yes gene_type:complete